MTQKLLNKMFEKGYIFKSTLVGKVNPELLQRLWLSKPTTEILVYKTKFGITILKKKTAFGIYEEILYPLFNDPSTTKT